MKVIDGPLAYFITWTVYGTFLQGDSRWWRKKRAGSQAPQPRLEEWHRHRLKHDVILLSRVHRDSVNAAIEEHCSRRSWKLWIANARANHVHVVVSAFGYQGVKVRDQLKANCTRSLRDMDSQFTGRPVWTSKGDVKMLFTDDELESAIQYAGEAQDRMRFGK